MFAPPVAEIYPDWPSPPATTVSVRALADRWEGASRPGHFDGVATVVTKFLSAAGRCRTYFGEKDFQQLAVVRRVVRDLSLPAEVVGCPTVREPDGLALSSRNARLSPAERAAAASLSGGPRPPAPRPWPSGADRPGSRRPWPRGGARAAGRPRLRRPGRTPRTSSRPSTASAGPLRLLIAARVGPVRLIDNLDPRCAR